MSRAIIQTRVQYYPVNLLWELSYLRASSENHSLAELWCWWTTQIFWCLCNFYITMSLLNFHNLVSRQLRLHLKLNTAKRVTQDRNLDNLFMCHIYVPQHISWRSLLYRLEWALLHSFLRKTVIVRQSAKLNFIKSLYRYNINTHICVCICVYPCFLLNLLFSALSLPCYNTESFCRDIKY